MTVAERPGPAQRPALLIANEKSRRGDAVAPFVAALQAGGMTIRREPCADRAGVADTIRALAGEVSCVLLGGGDGTMNAAASALCDTGLALGILPLGTANDLARSVGIPTDPQGAASIIVAGRTRVVDLGTVNGIPFFNVASLGLSVAVTKRLTRLIKQRFGMLAYPLAAVRTIVSTRRFSVSLVADGVETTTTTLQVAVGNGRFYGGGNLVDAKAEIDDGILDVYSLEPRARWRLLFMARAFRAGEHLKLREVRTLRCRSLVVTTKRPRHITADGEIVSSTPATFALLRHAVRVFAP